MGRGGVLLVKGLKSMWRQAAPIVRNTLQGALRRIIMQVHTVNTLCCRKNSVSAMIVATALFRCFFLPLLSASSSM